MSKEKNSLKYYLDNATPRTRRMMIVIFITLGLVVFIAIASIFFLETVTQKYLKFLVGQQVEVMRANALASSGERMGYLSRDAQFISSMGKENADEILDLLNMFSDEVITGIMDADGNVVSGVAIEVEKFDLLRKVRQGQGGFKYYPQEGVLMTIPMVYEKGEMYYIYRLVRQQHMNEVSKTSFFRGEGSAFTVDVLGNMVIEPDMDEAGIAQLNNDTKLIDAFKEIRGEAKLGEVETAEVDCSFGRVFAFAAPMAQTGLIMEGFVPMSVVGSGVDTILRVASSVFLLMVVVLVALSVLLLVMERRNQDIEELEKEKQIAERSNRAKSDFLANVSHEIRTPINAVLGMNEMILRETRSKTIKGYAYNIEGAGKSLLALINDLLDFSKIESGKMELVEAPYELSSALNDVSNMIWFKANQKKLDFQVHVSDKIPDKLYGDVVRVKQVLTNILNNAVKYTEIGSVTFEAGCFRTGPYMVMLEFTVRDTGIGIKEEDKNKLFTKFSRVDLQKNNTIEGTGLGLVITENLLELMGGDISLESEYGKGSCFKVRIPQKVMGTEMIGNFREKFEKSLKENAVYKESFIAPSARILAVDDTAINLTVIEGLLKKTQVKIDTALSGKEALRKVKNNVYDLIFLDFRMPEMDGIETLKAMKAMSETENLNLKTPVICLTANAIVGARDTYIKAGFDDYLTKPVDYERLEKMMINYLPEDKITIVKGDEEEEPDSDLNLPGWLMDVEGLDPELGVRNCGSEESYMETLRIFNETIEATADEIENYWKHDQWDNYTTKVHALKSSARIIGATQLSENARYMESCGNEGRVDEILKYTPPLLQEYRGFVKKLKKLNNETETEKKEEISQDQLQDAYQSLVELAEVMDYDSAMFIVKSMEDLRLPPEEKDRIRSLKAAVSNLEWDKVKELLKT
ncbi:MAG: response regulator [Lachnospiraceae bacterium]|nr:response regulator [Lachnospiraceae bacterium]